MKKLLSVVVFYLSLLASTAYALDMIQVGISGSTTAKSGTSTFSIITYGTPTLAVSSDTSTIDLNKFASTNGLYSIQLVSVLPTVNVTAGTSIMSNGSSYYSGNTVQLLVELSSEQSALWGAQEKIPITPAFTLSGVSTGPSTFDSRGMRFMRIYGVSGISPYLTVIARVVNQGQIGTPILIGESVYTINASSGISSFSAAPLGAGLAMITNDSSSGVSIMVTKQTTRNVNVPDGVDVGDKTVISGSLAEIRAHGVHTGTNAAGTAYVKVKWYSRKFY